MALSCCWRDVAIGVASASALAALVLLRARRRRRIPPLGTSAAPATDIPRVGDASEVREAVHAEGCCILERVLDADAVRTLRERLGETEPRKLQNRRAHRWEHVHSPEAPPFAELADLAPIAAAVRSLLGPKTYLEKAGMILSQPGAEVQRWHMDTPHLFSMRCAAACRVSMPCRGAVHASRACAWRGPASCAAWALPAAQRACTCVRSLAEWQSGRVAEWQSGRVAEWQSGRLAGWQAGRLAGWQAGRLAGWQAGTGGAATSRATMCVMRPESGARCCAACCSTHLPPHSLSVFIPLCDLVPSNGPTEFQLGTHIKANLVCKQRHALACCAAGSLVLCAPRPPLPPCALCPPVLCALPLPT